MISQNSTKLFSLLLVAAIMAVSAFGFMAVSHDGMNCDPSVPASTCPPSRVSMSFHHVSSYVNLMTAMFSPIVASFSIILALIPVLIIARHSPRPLEPIYQSIDRSRQIGSFSLQPRKITRWLSIFENSPSA